jgi:hypothetical protein
MRRNPLAISLAVTSIVLAKNCSQNDTRRRMSDDRLRIVNVRFGWAMSSHAAFPDARRPHPPRSVARPEGYTHDAKVPRSRTIFCRQPQLRNKVTIRNFFFAVGRQRPFHRRE